MSVKKQSLFRSAMAGIGIRPPVFDAPPRGFVLPDVTVVSPGLHRKEMQSLVVKDSTITSIRDRIASDTDGAENVFYAGAFALPGLIDMHVHYPVLPSRFTPSTFDISEWAGPLFLAHGVTTVRDVGSFDTIWNLQKKVTDGEFPCPRVFCCGQILDGNPPRWGEQMSWVIQTPEEASTAVNRLADRGACFIKVYDNLTQEALSAIREAASLRGLPVVGHLPFKVPFEDARIDDLQHLWAIQLPELYPGLDFNNPKDFAAYFKAWVEIDEKRLDDIVRISVEQKIAHTPTIVVQDRIARMNDVGAMDDPDKFLLPRFFRDVLWSPEYGIQYLKGHAPEVYSNLKKGIAIMKTLVGRMHQAGVKVFTGTDGAYNPFTTPGVSLQEELLLLVDSGMTPEDAWVAGTLDPGEFLGVPGLGTLAEGAPADILIFREDPTKDLSALSTLEAVAVDGRLYSRDTLEKVMEKHRNYFESWLYDRSMVAIMKSTLKKV